MTAIVVRMTLNEIVSVLRPVFVRRPEYVRVQFEWLWMQALLSIGYASGEAQCSIGICPLRPKEPVAKRNDESSPLGWALISPAAKCRKHQHHWWRGA